MFGTCDEMSDTSYRQTIVGSGTGEPSGAVSRGKMILLFALIAALAFVVRLNLATSVRTCLSGDEAVAGVMAYHIEDRGEHPIYAYGESHSGCTSILAHAAAVFNAAFGRSMLTARAPTMLSFALFAGISMLLGMRAIGALPGIFVGLHIIFSPHFYGVSLLAVGYMEVLTIMVLCCYIVYTRMMGEPGTASAKEQNPPPIMWGVLVGVLSGAAYWGVEYTAMMTAALFAAYGLRWRKKAFPVLLGWAVSFPLGAFPVIKYNLNNDFLNFRYLAKGHFLKDTASVNISEFFTKELPALFQNDNISLYLHGVPWIAWLLFIATSLGCLLAIFFSIRNKSSGSGILKFGLLYCVFYCAMYLASPFSGETPRYLLPLEPFLSIGLVAGITALVRTRAVAARCLAAALIAFVITADVGGTLYALKDNTVDVRYDMDVECDVIYGKIDRMARALEERGVSHVYTNWFLKWMIMFRTEEKIVAANVNLVPAAVRWTEFEDVVLAGDSAAFFFTERDPHVPWLRAYLGAHGIPFYSATTDNYVLIHPLRDVSGVEFITWCHRTHKARTQRELPEDF